LASIMVAIRSIGSKVFQVSGMRCVFAEPHKKSRDAGASQR
jgi:hypothetical protein